MSAELLHNILSFERLFDALHHTEDSINEFTIKEFFAHIAQTFKEKLFPLDQLSDFQINWNSNLTVQR
jgi:hypothetical protein